MSDSEQASERREALVENIDKRENLPAGWRGIYDQLIVDLYKVQPNLRIETVRAKLGELRVYPERHSSPGKEPEMLIARAIAASRAACEVCGQTARGHTVSGVFRRLCAAHLRAAQAMEAARLQIFDGDRQGAELWMQTRSLHLGETPNDRAVRSPEGLRDVLTMISRMEGGVYL